MTNTGEMRKRVLASSGGVVLLAEFEKRQGSPLWRVRTNQLRLLYLGAGQALLTRVDMGVTIHDTTRVFSAHTAISLPGGDEVAALTASLLYNWALEATDEDFDAEIIPGVGDREFTFHVLTPQGTARLPVRFRLTPEATQQEYQAWFGFDLREIARSAESAAQ